MIGSKGPRMLAMTLPYVDPWNVWFSDTRNEPAGVAAAPAVVDDACRAVGRDPADVERTVAVQVLLPGGAGRVQGGYAEDGPVPLEGSPERIADELRAYAREGIDHVQLVLDPITRESIETVALALAVLDRDRD